MKNDHTIAALCALRDKFCANVLQDPPATTCSQVKDKGIARSTYASDLPSFDTFVREFGLFISQNGANHETSSSICKPEITSDGHIFCACLSCSRWKDFCGGSRASPGETTAVTWGARQYEILSKEFVEMLVDYLLSRARAYQLDTLHVLEVGAGNGLLAEHIRRISRNKRASNIDSTQLAHAVPQIEVIAVDNNSLGLADGTMYGEVVKMDAVEAIYKFPADIVICCWQPLGIDWTAAMRSRPTLREYLLVGETDDGICGHWWLTWGHRILLESSDDDNTSPSSSPSRNPSLQLEDSSSEYGPVHDTRHGTSPDLDMSATRGPCPEHGISAEHGASLFCSAHGRTPEYGTGSGCFGHGQRVRDGETSGEQGDERRHFEPQLEQGDDGSPRCRGSTRMPCKRKRRDGAAPAVPGQDAIKQGGAPNLPPYVADGFVREDLTWFNPWQICRTDERWSTRHHSHVVAFQRAATAPKINSYASR